MDGNVLLEAIELIKGFLAGFEPDRYPGVDAAELVRRFTTIERLGAAGKTLAAGRVESSGVWRSSGDRSAEAWLAAETGSTVSESVGVLFAAGRVAGLEATGAAMREGRLSAQQTAAVVSAAAVDPDSESRLLATADRRQSLRALRDQARSVRQAARGEAALADRERIHRSRYLRHWTSDDGAFEGRFRLTPDHGAVVLAALEAHRGSGTTDAAEADALVAVARSAGRGSAGSKSDGPLAVIHVRVDYEALRRGHTEAGETCEIEGIGPIPVATARRAAEDAILRAVLTDGDRVIDECTAGRTVSTRMRESVKARDRTCAVPGCDETNHLQVHHLHDVHLGGPTKLTNLARVCPYHHDQITYKGAELSGAHPDWHWRPPPGRQSAFGATGDRGPAGDSGPPGDSGSPGDSAPPGGSGPAGDGGPPGGGGPAGDGGPPGGGGPLCESGPPADKDRRDGGDCPVTRRAPTAGDAALTSSGPTDQQPGLWDRPDPLPDG